jgi:hypothetical protein
MRFICKICFLLASVALLCGTARAATFTASLDRDTMTLGEQATLSLKFEGVQPQNAPAIPGIAGLEFQYIGPASSFSVINGQVSSSITYNYLVSAKRDGEFTFPAMRADVGGQQLACEAVKLVVTKVDSPAAADVAAGREAAFLKLVVPKNKLYVGEPMVGQLELYLREDVQDVRGFQLTSSATDGFSAGKTAEQPDARRRTQIGNHAYTVIPLALPLTTVRSGSLTLGPFTANVVIGLPSQTQGGDPFFRQFFNQTEQKQLTLATESVTVHSLPLPDEKKPTNFSGAVGDFTMSATVGPTTVTVGDPITVRIQISGSGVLDALTLAPQDAWRDFKTYPPTTKVEATDHFGFQGSKTFEQIISPKNAEVHELPALTFCFFNPEDGQYHTLSQAAVPLVVRAAAATLMPSVVASKNPAPESQPRPDILPLKDKLGPLLRNYAPLVVQPGFLATQSLPLLAFLAAFIWRQHNDRLANNPRLRRHRAVVQLVASGLAELKKYAAANQPDQFFAMLFRLLQEQLGERLDCPASAITENVVEEQALLRRAPAATRDALREQFQLCNQARYAPLRGSSELNLVAAQFEKVIRELQDLKP